MALDGGAAVLVGVRSSAIGSTLGVDSSRAGEGGASTAGGVGVTIVGGGGSAAALKAGRAFSRLAENIGLLKFKLFARPSIPLNLCACVWTGGGTGDCTGGGGGSLLATDFSEITVSNIVVGAPTFLRADSFWWRNWASIKSLKVTRETP